jgi:poly-gamma-glutamate system protein
MEAAIVAAGVLPAASRGITIGGGRDRGRDLEPEGLEMARQIQALAARALEARVLTTWTLAEAIAARLDIYRAALKGQPPRVYVNVGGNHASLGGAGAPFRHEEGWIDPAEGSAAAGTTSVIGVWLAEGVAALNLLDVKGLARSWGM